MIVVGHGLFPKIQKNETTGALKNAINRFIFKKTINFARKVGHVGPAFRTIYHRESTNI